jgi:hypothetical protein
MPTNPAAEADALAVAGPAGAVLAEAVLTGAVLTGAVLTGAVAATALVAGPVADGLPLPCGELLQPAAKPIRAANTAARTAAVPMVLAFLFMAFLSIRFSVAWCHELFTRASGTSSCMVIGPSLSRFQGCFHTRAKRRGGTSAARRKAAAAVS